MKLAMRYGLVGLGALGTLSLVHAGRTSQYSCPEMCLALMGVLPNLAAAIAIPFVLLSIWADQKPNALYASIRQAFARFTLLAGVGLIAWEFIQRTSKALVFDINDIGATFVGIGLGWLVFTLLTPRTSANGP